MDPIVLSLIVGVLALGFAGYLAATVLKEDQGTKQMMAIQVAIQEGAMAFLTREYQVLAGFVVVVAITLGVVLGSASAAIAYVFGTICSAGAGFIGMNIAVRANVRTAAAAMQGLNRGLRVAFNSGAVMGITVVGIGVAGIAIVYLITRDVNVAAGFSFGASSIALFARVGGGIYTKAADVGADLVGKVE
ncbi:MAG: sodium/proton-translocating pyrophosphatase, partial [Chloroflexi bacterium]|nr:sodium/proton-translocating pyrophosphatase [Chloroflexota bacterium]